VAGSAGGIVACVVIVILLYSGKQNQPADFSRRQIPEHKMAGGVVTDTSTLPDSVPDIDMHEDSVVSDREVSPRDSIIQAQCAEIAAEMSYVLLAHKKEKQLYVIRWGESDTIIENSFFMASGKRRGAKQSAGDNRTPEGNYFIIGRKDTEQLNAVYGPLAYVLNYPNRFDKQLGRTGDGIWIHGTAPDSAPVDTRGCLEVRNDDLRVLSSYIGIGVGVPVVIVEGNGRAPETIPEYGMLAEQRDAVLSWYKEKQRFFSDLLLRWKRAWESENIERYEMFYNTEAFFGQDLNWQQWRERKIRTFERYEYIDIEISDVQVCDVSDSLAVVKFFQLYSSDIAAMKNAKRLDFTKSNGTWKIEREESIPREELLL
jgi:hypothetical protein